MVDDGIEHHAEDADTDHNADDHDQHVKVINLSANGRDAGRHIHLVIAEGHCRQYRYSRERVTDSFNN